MPSFIGLRLIVYEALVLYSSCGKRQTKRYFVYVP